MTFYRRLAADRRTLGGHGPVLDLACGTGRLTIPLLRDGHTVVGLDRSHAMLERARARVAKLPFEVVTRATAPFLVPLIAVLVLITVFPELVLWLPRLVLG